MNEHLENGTQLYTMKVIKISTAGSVDDGKSTLIGRLLYDTNSLPSDKVVTMEETSRRKGYDYLDFSLATDGLSAEMEQGVTIDVAHVYFASSSRRYIIADSPGHIEYTRNMITGSSTSQVSIILIDARNGVVEQTFRHFFITDLIQIKDIIVVVNKMDLVHYDQKVFNNIKKTFEKLKKNSTNTKTHIHYVPISALYGDNVVKRSEKMPWYEGESVLEHLENLKISDLYTEGTMRFPIQTVIRPKNNKNHDFRGYAGKVYGGEISVGDEVCVLPSRTKSKISAIHLGDQQYKKAGKQSSVILELEDDLHASRGNLITKIKEIPREGKKIRSRLCWMDAEPLVIGEKYILQHNTQTLVVRVEEIENIIYTDFSGVSTAEKLQLNEIGTVLISLSNNMFYDLYTEHRANGSFILINKQTHTTVAMGVIIE